MKMRVFFLLLLFGLMMFTRTAIAVPVMDMGFGNGVNIEDLKDLKGFDHFNDFDDDDDDDDDEDDFEKMFK